MTTYANPGPMRIPNWKRCKVRHSPQTPARCKLTRGHEGDHRFGVWRTGVQAIYLDQPTPKPLGLPPAEPEDARPAE